MLIPFPCERGVAALLACSVIVCGSAPVRRALADPTTDTAERLARFCIDGFVTSREQLDSGVVRIVETGKADGQASPKHEYFVAFDRASRRTRFDDTSRGRNLRSIRLLDRDILTVSPSRTVSVYLPGAMPRVEGADPIDLRVVGIATLSEFEARSSYDAITELLTHASVKQTREGTEDQYVLAARYPMHPAGAAERSVWLDKRRGFCPTRMELKMLTDKAPAENTEPLEWATVEWEKKSNIWVPIRSEFRRVRPDAQKRVEFRWESVGDRPSPATFEIASIAPKDAFVADFRLGKPVTVPLDGFENPPNPEGPEALRTPPMAPFRLTFIACNLVLIAVLSLLVWRKHRADVVDANTSGR